jgi:hypothetical protein
VDGRPLARNQSLPREHSWIPDTTVATLRDMISKYLGGDVTVDADVERLAASLATSARASELTPERMLIALRALWREFIFTQHDRLQLASLYDQLVRRTIDKYYEE